MADTKEKEGRNYFTDDGIAEAGIPWNKFLTALQVWSFMRPGDKQATVREAGDQFGVTDAVIRRAVEEHPWMLLCGPPDDPTKQYIDHDGNRG